MSGRYRVMDIECYPNYFLLLTFDAETGTIYRWERHNDVEIGRPPETLHAHLKGHVSITFNGLCYDWWMLAAYVSKRMTNAKLKTISDYLIKVPLASWSVADRFGLVTLPYAHIDIMPVAPLVASLKLYAGRLNAPRLQDLPVAPQLHITPAYRDVLRRYCINDVHVTHLLHAKLKPQVLLRLRIGKVYGMELLSKSDPQIAEAVLKKLLTERGVTLTKPKRLTDSSGKLFVPPMEFKYDVPACVNMQSPEIADVLRKVCESKFVTGQSGTVLSPKLLHRPVEYHGSKYKLGVGGLHSQEKCRTIRIKPGEFLTDLDVTSYYPSIILTNGFYPASIGKTFIDVYRGIVNQRVAAKNMGDKVRADSLKIVINSSFGKLGNPYSVLYSPKLLIQTTFTGQLYLFMLIEQIEERTDCKVVSANTDGVTVHSPNPEQYDKMIKVSKEWERRTSMGLEAVQYSALFSQDVNNYLAVKLDGSTKGKGVFAPPSLSKNPINPIVVQAATQWLINRTDPVETIHHCTDITQFCSLRKVTGGALYKDTNIGATIRWYHSTKGSPILYYKDARRVPDAEDAAMAQILPDSLPTDINYDWYVAATRKLVNAVNG